MKFLVFIKNLLPFFLAFELIFVQISVLKAQASNIIPDGSTNTTVISAPNGVTIVNIADPSNSGTSINNFDQFNVSPSGVILNNSQVIVNTELSGVINSNGNINSPAGVIVGEVTSLAPSNLLGFTEVAGQKAEFVLLNPNGISCNGCGFINIGSLTLATGSGQYNDGMLKNIVTGLGSINFEGKGVNATLTDYFRIISQNVRVNAPISAGRELEIHAGKGVFDVQNNGFSSTQSFSGIGIDASAFGSMYAGKITLNASSVGLGVNLGGAIVAANSGLIINAKGDINYESLTSAGNLQVSGQNIKGNSASSKQDVNIQGANISAQNITSEGSVKIAGGEVNAGISSKKDTNITGNNIQANINAEGRVEAMGNNFAKLKIASKQYVNIKGGNINADVNSEGNIDIAGNSITSGEKIVSKGNISIKGDKVENNFLIASSGLTSISATNFINHGKLQSGSTLLIYAQNIVNSNLVSSVATLDLKGVSVVNNQGTIASKGEVRITETGELKNSGVLKSNGGMNLTTASLTNSGSVESSANLSLNSERTVRNEGKILANGVLKIKGVNLLFQNLKDGSVQSLEKLEISANNFENSGGVSSKNSSVDVVANKLTNGGKLQAGRELLIHGKDVINSGLISGFSNLNILSNSTINNSGTVASGGSMNLSGTSLINNSGKIESNSDLNLTSEGEISSSNNITVIGKINIQAESLNTSNKIQANGDVNIKANNINANGDVISGNNIIIQGNNIKSEEKGNINAEGNIKILADNIESNGDVTSNNSSIEIKSNNLTNSGKVQAGSTLLVHAKNIINSGIAFAIKNFDLTGASTIDNSGTIASNSNISLLASAEINNSGTLIGDGDIDLSSILLINKGNIKGNNVNLISDGKVSNNGKIISNGALNVKGAGLSFQNQENGLVQSSGTLNISANTFGNEGNINSQHSSAEITANNLTNSGKLQAGAKLLIHGNDVINSGLISGLSNLNVLSNSTINNSGVVASNGNMNLLATSFVNNSGSVESNGDLNLTSDGKITNNGKITVIGNFAMEGETINTSNQILTNGDIKIKTKELSNQGKLQTGANLLVETQNIANSGLLSSVSSLDLKGTSIANNQGKIVSGGKMSLFATSKINNTGKIESNGNLNLSSEGEISSSNDITVIGKIDIKSESLNTSNKIHANGDVNIKAGNVNANGDVISGGDIIITGVGLNSNGKGNIYAEGNIKILAEKITSNNIIAQGDVEIKASNLASSGKLQAGSNLWVDALNILNHGLISSVSNLNLKGSKEMKNDGIIVSNNNMSLISDGGIYNNHQIVSNGGLEIKGANLFFQNSNKGLLQSVGNLNILANTFENNNDVISGGKLNVESENIKTNGAIQANGDVDFKSSRIETKGDIISSGSITIAGTNFNTNANTNINAHKNIKITVGAFNSASNSKNNIIAQGDVEIKTKGDFINNIGDKLQAGANLSVNGQNIVNSGLVSAVNNLNLKSTSTINNQGILAGDGEVSLSGVLLLNTGEIEGGRNLNLTSESTVLNNGKIVAVGNLGIKTEILNSSNKIRANGDINITAKQFSNKGNLQSGKSLAIQGSNIVNSGLISALSSLGLTGVSVLHNQGTMASNGNMSLPASNEIINSGTLTSNAKMSLSSAVVNNTGNIESNDDLNVTSTNAISNNGKLVSNGMLGIKGQGITNSNIISSNKNLTIEGKTLGLNGSSSIIANENIKIKANTITGKKNIIANGDIEIRAENDFHNNGGDEIKAGSNLLVEAPNIFNSGLISAFLNLNLSSITAINNQGTLASNANMSLSSSIINNSGGIESNGNLNITGSTVFNNGKMAAVRNLAIKTESLKTNRQIQANGDVNITATELLNEGQLQSGSSLSIYGRSIINNGLISAYLNAKLVGTSGLYNNSKIESGGTLSLFGNSFTNTASSSLNATNLLIANSENGLRSALSDFTNNGAINTAGGLSFAVNNFLNLASINAGSLNIGSSNFTNNNSILTTGAINITASGTFINNSKMQANGVFVVSANTITNNAFLASLGDMNLTGASSIVNSNTNKAIIVSVGNMGLYSNGAITNYREINSMAGLTIGGLNGGSTNLVTNETLSTDFAASIKAKGNLSILAQNLKNKGFDVWGSKEGYDIQKKIYDVKPVKNIFTMYAELFATSNVKTINSKIISGNDMLINSNVLNHGGNILAGGNMQINGNVENKVTRFEAKNLWQKWFKDASYWQDGAMSGPHDGSANLVKHNIYKTTHNQQTLTSNDPSRIGANGNLAITGAQITNHAGNASFNSKLGAPIEASSANLSANSGVNTNISNPQINPNLSLKPGVNANATINSQTKPNLSLGANTNISLKPGTSSKPEVDTSISTNSKLKPGLNPELNLGLKPEIEAGSILKPDTSTDISLKPGSTESIPKPEVNDNSSVKPNLPSKPDVNAGVTLKPGVNLKPTPNSNALAEIDSLNIPQMDIPSILNSGLFTTEVSGKVQIAGNVSFDYLVESNLQFTSKDKFITSDYFFKAISFHPDKNITLLGDAMAERELITNSLAKLGAVKFLNGNNKAIDELYQNGASWFNENKAGLNLTFGVSLTQEQVSSLTSDIILPVFKVINGVEVLVPQVFLSNGTLANLNTQPGGVIFAGGDISLNGTDIINSGHINSNGSLVVVAQNNFINSGGKINVAQNFKASANNILFDAIKTSHSQSVVSRPSFFRKPVPIGTISGETIQALSAVKVGGNMGLNAIQNITTQGTNFNIKGNAGLNAGGDVKFEAAKSSFEYHVGKEDISKTSSVASHITAGGGLIMNAGKNIITQGSNLTGEKGIGMMAGGDIFLGVTSDVNNASSFSNSNHTSVSKNTIQTASSLQSNGDINITSGGNFALVAAQSTSESTVTTTKEGGLFSKSKTTTETTFSSKMDAGEITSTGGGITIKAKENLNIVASNLTAEKDITLNTQKSDVNIVAGVDVEASSVETTKKGMFSSQVNIDKTYKETIVSSNINSKSDIIINANNDINILASNLNGVNGNLEAVNGNINATSMQNLDYDYTFEQKTQISMAALALQVTVAVAVGAVTAGAGTAALFATGMLTGTAGVAGSVMVGSSMLATGAIAGATAVGVGHGISIATQGNNAFEQFKGGENKGTTTITTQNVNSNLNFSGDLSLNAGKELNTSQATISSQNINQEGLDTSKITTKEVKKEEIKPQYGDIAKGAAITGAIAGATVVAGKVIEATKADYAKDTGRTVSEGKSTLFDAKSPNGGFSNSKLGVNSFYDEAGNLIKEGTKNEIIPLWSSDQNPLFKTLNTLPGSPSFVDWHDAALQMTNSTGQLTTAGQIAQSLSLGSKLTEGVLQEILTIGTIPPFFAVSQCVAMPSICANFPDLFVNIGTGGLIKPNLNDQIKPKTDVQVNTNPRSIFIRN